jgi:hypothetical protein
MYAGPSYSRWLNLATAALVFLLALGVYLQTLAPSIIWAHDGVDSGDFAAAIASGGVPHPPGYPTYLLAGEIFRLLPWGDVAHRLNVMSALAAAAASALMALIVGSTLRDKDPAASNGKQFVLWVYVSAASAGLLFAFTPIVWSQAVITEVYTIHALFFCAILAMSLWARRTKNCGVVLLTFATLGLGLGNHLSLVLAVPSLLYLLWDLIRGRPGRFILYALSGLALGLAVYGVLPWRAAHVPAVNWGGASTLAGFWWLVSAQLYRGFVFSLPLAHFPMRILAWLRLLVIGVNVWGIPAGILGLNDLWERDRRLAISTLLTFLLYSAYAILYDTTDSYVYLIPTVAVLVLWAGHGLYWVLTSVAPRLERRWGKWSTVVLVALVAVLSVGSLPWRWTSQDLSADTVAMDYAGGALRDADPDALIVAEGDAHTFSLWYARYGLRSREDVAVVNDALLAYDWYRTVLQKYHPDVMQSPPGLLISDLFSLLAANADRRPVYFSDKPEYLPPGYQAVASGSLWKLTPAE